MRGTSIGLATTLVWMLASGVASAGLWTEVGDAGELAGGQNTDGVGGLTAITGDILGTRTDVDMYLIKIVNEASFSASTVGGATFDTKLYLFGTDGKGVVNSDDAPGGGGRSTLTSTFVTANGLYWLAVAHYVPGAADYRLTGLGYIWNNSPYGEKAPDGPGAANALAGWINKFPTDNVHNAYTIALTGADYATPEPGTLGLLAVGGLALARRRRA